jgi:CDGSH-type Zn-finger protein
MKENKIKISKNGPYLISGDIPLEKETIVVDADDCPINWERGKKFPEKSYSLCRCGKSENKPFCDGTHTKVNFDGTETAEQKYTGRVFRGPGMDLVDIRELCAGAGFCDGGIGTWKLTKESGNPENKKMAIQQACNCPSGRLIAVDKGKEIEPKFEQSISLVEEPARKCSGPLWAKGKIPIESADGKEYEKRNRVTLCRCGKSNNKPFCDGSHAAAGFDDGMINSD